MTHDDKQVLKGWGIGICIVASIIMIIYVMIGRTEIIQDEYDNIAKIKAEVDNQPQDKGYDYIRVWIKTSTEDGYISNREYRTIMREIKVVQKQNRINELRN